MKSEQSCNYGLNYTFCIDWEVKWHVHVQILWSAKPSSKCSHESVSSYFKNNTKSLLLFTCLFLSNKYPIKVEKTLSHYFNNVTSGIHWKNIATVFLFYVAGECRRGVNTVFRNNCLNEQRFYVVFTYRYIIDLLHVYYYFHFTSSGFDTIS